jgi:hypothetical protein
MAKSGRPMLRRAAGFPVTKRIEDVIRIVRNRRDLVQAHHFSGEFYEAEELQIIQKYFKAGGIFVNIGANVGNHTVFAQKYWLF